jgi:hypothetical protein
MQNRDFEKQVQDKMAELSFTPTPPVWMNIEEKIRQRKERRRMIFWLPLLAIGLGAAAWWMLSGGENNPGTIALTPEQQHQSIPGAGAPQQTNPSLPGQAETHPGKKGTDQENLSRGVSQHSTSLPPASTATINTRDKLAFQQNGRLATSIQKVHKSARPGTGKSSTQPAEQHTSIQNPALPENQEVKLETAEKAPVKMDASPIIPLVNPSNKNIPDKKNNDTAKTLRAVVSTASSYSDTSVATETTAATATVLPSVTPDTVAAVSQPQPPKKRGWTILPSVAYGWSKVGKGIELSMAKAVNQDVMFTGNASSVGVPIMIYSPSPVYPGRFFSVGFLAQKEITPAVHFTTGIEYRYFNNYINTGGRQATDTFVLGRNTRVEQYFQLANMQGSQALYRNNYHFVSVPLEMNMRVLRKVPLFLNAGIALQQLVSTNALYYSQQMHIYYEDKEALRKTQFMARLGAHITLFHKKKWPVQVGPEFNLGLSRIQKTPGSVDRFYANAINVRLPL